MSLVRYEFSKVYAKKTVWAVLAGMLAAGCLLFYLQCRDDYFLNYKDEVAAMEAQYGGTDAQTALETLEAAENDENLLAMYRSFASMVRDDPSMQSTLDAFLADNPGFLEAHAGDPRLDPDYGGSITALYTVLTQARHIAGYPAYLDGIRANAESMLKVSIFQKKGSFSYNNILKTPGDFEKLKGVQLSFGYENGIVKATQYRLQDIFVPLGLFLVCLSLFLYEQENGLTKLVRSARRGGAPTIGAKLCVLCVTAVVLALLYNASVLLIGAKVYGYGDLSRAVQSLPSFADCTLRVSVGGYLALWLGLKVLAALVTAVLMALCFVVFHSGKSIFAVTVAFGAASYLCWRYIHEASWLNLLKFVNIFSLYDGYTFWGRYLNINFFTLPVSRVILCLSAAAAVLVPGGALCVFCFTRGVRADFIDRFLTRIEGRAARRRAGRPLRGNTSLFLHELRKLVVTERAWVVLLAAAYLAYSFTDLAPLTLHTQADAAYAHYIQQWGGVVTEEKAAAIEEENAYFESLYGKVGELSAAYVAGEITYDEYAGPYYEASSYISQYGEGFSVLYGQYEEAVSLAETEAGYVPSLTDRQAVAYWTENGGRDLLRGLLAVLLTLLALSRVFPLDGEKGMAPVLRSTQKGSSPLIGAKIAVSALAAVFIWACMCLPATVTLLHKYSLSTAADIRSIAIFAGSGADCTVGTALAVFTAASLLAVLLSAAAVLFAGSRIGRMGQTILITAAVLGVPVLAAALGASFMDLFSLKAAFVPCGAFAARGWGILWYGAALVCVTAALAALLFRRERSR